MQVGDIIPDRETPDGLDKLPERAVAVCQGRNDDDFNVLIRTADGFDWRGKDGRVSHYGKVYAGNWTVVYLPAVPALKVGDVIETEAQADALPVGTVVVDDEERVPVCAPAIKVEDDRWLFHGVSRGVEYTDNETVFDHRILHIPARADTGSVRTAA